MSDVQVTALVHEVVVDGVTVTVTHERPGAMGPGHDRWTLKADADTDERLLASGPARGHDTYDAAVSAAVLLATGLGRERALLRDYQARVRGLYEQHQVIGHEELHGRR